MTLGHPDRYATSDEYNEASRRHERDGRRYLRLERTGRILRNTAEGLATVVTGELIGIGAAALFTGPENARQAAIYRDLLAGIGIFGYSTSVILYLLSRQTVSRAKRIRRSNETIDEVITAHEKTLERRSDATQAERWTFETQLRDWTAYEFPDPPEGNGARAPVPRSNP